MSFPAWYLLFTIPVPLDDVTIRLRMLSAGTAVGILNGLDMETGRLGTAIFSQLEDAEFYLDVADPCSGIRSLFAMMSLTAAYAHFMLESRLQRWMLFACSIPIAVAANIFRVLCICLVAHHYGQDAAVGFYHDFSAYVTFLLAILLMFFAKQLVVKIGSWLRKKRLFLQKHSAQDTTADTKSEYPLAVVCLTAALTVLTLVFF